GSALDTCKAVNLLTTYPAPLLDYINQPVGRGRPVPGPLKPLIAVPTTAGTGSETTAVAVTHVLAQHVKAGVSNRLLRPALGIGNAGVHIPHALAYPIAGLVREYVPSGYRTTHALVPHGISVVVTAPATFRFTYATSPERHLRAAELMGVPTARLSEREAREALPGALLALMRDVGIPNGLTALGYGESDIPALVEGTLKQPRLL